MEKGMFDPMMLNVMQERKTRLFDKLRSEFDPRIVQAMIMVPREIFMPPDHVFDAWDDRPYLLGENYGDSSISQPSTVALMTELLDPQPDETILEIGTATGYQAAILALLAKRVITIEHIPQLAVEAQARFRGLGFHNIDLVVADGSRHPPLKLVIDKLIVTASVPPPLVRALCQFVKVGGHIVMPVGGIDGYTDTCNLILVERMEHDITVTEEYPDYRFVPLMGDFGWVHFLHESIEKLYATHYYIPFGRNVR